MPVAASSRSNRPPSPVVLPPPVHLTVWGVLARMARWQLTGSARRAVRQAVTVAQRPRRRSPGHGDSDSSERPDVVTCPSPVPFQNHRVVV